MIMPLEDNMVLWHCNVLSIEVLRGLLLCSPVCLSVCPVHVSEGLPVGTSWVRSPALAVFCDKNDSHLRFQWRYSQLLAKSKLVPVMTPRNTIRVTGHRYNVQLKCWNGVDSPKPKSHRISTCVSQSTYTVNHSTFILLCTSLGFIWSIVFFGSSSLSEICKNTLAITTVLLKQKLSFDDPKILIVLL